MATPKKKVSRSRRNMRRFAGGSNKLAKPTASTCPSCNEPKRPHGVCSCGHYNGKQIIAGVENKS